MKIKLRIPIWIATVLAAVFLAVQGAAKIEAPSDILSKENPPFSMRFVFRPLDDMRRLYCDQDIIADRRKRSVCRVDASMQPSWRREVTVSTNSNLREVLAFFGVTNWTGGSQIRIVKRNEILQSPWPRHSGAELEPWRRFSETQIEPADLVIMCSHD